MCIRDRLRSSRSMGCAGRSKHGRPTSLPSGASWGWSGCGWSATTSPRASLRCTPSSLLLRGGGGGVSGRGRRGVRAVPFTHLWRPRRGPGGRSGWAGGEWRGGVGDRVMGRTPLEAFPVAVRPFPALGICHYRFSPAPVQREVSPGCGEGRATRCRSAGGPDAPAALLPVSGPAGPPYRTPPFSTPARAQREKLPTQHRPPAYKHLEPETYAGRAEHNQ